MTTPPPAPLGVSPPPYPLLDPLPLFPFLLFLSFAAQTLDIAPECRGFSLSLAVIGMDGMDVFLYVPENKFNIHVNGDI